jgi:hypothetical protein
MIKNDMKARIDLPGADSDEYKFLIKNGWSVKREELICTENEMYQFLDKNGPADIEEIKKAFPKHSEDDLRNAIGTLVYTAKTVDSMNGIKGGMSLGVFVTSRHQKNWANKVQRHRNSNKPVSMCDYPNPDVDIISTCENKPKVADVVNSTVTTDESPEVAAPEVTVNASITLPKVVQKMLRKDIIEKAASTSNFDAYISSLSPEHKCYWNEYLDDFKRKLILTEIKKKLTPG